MRQGAKPLFWRFDWQFFILFLVVIAIQFKSVVNCNVGEYAYFAFFCEPCPVGFRCPNGSDKYECIMKYYQPLEGQSSCLSCDSGSYVQDNDCHICEIGYECPGDGTKSPCTGNQFSSSTGQSSCDSCPSGSYVQDNDCHICEIGYECPGDGTRLYCTGNQHSNATGLPSCYNCTIGSYVEDHQCWECPINFECPGNGNKSECNPPQYTLQAGLGECLTCDQGNYYITSPIDCIPCEIGYACDGSGSQQECISPHYTDSPSQVSCDTCPSGMWVTTQAGSIGVACSTCPIGHECDGSGNKTGCIAPQYTDQAGQVNCSTCLSGSYIAQFDANNFATDCKVCEIGYSCNDGTSRTPCYSPQYTNVTGLASCDFCPAGSYVTLNGDNTGNNCHLCDVGHFCNGNGTEVACTAPQYADEEGMSQCSNCTEGHFVTENMFGASIACYMCHKGHFCDGSGRKESCILPEFSNDVGRKSCVTCQEGHFAVTRELSDTIAWEYTYNYTHCVPCSPGFYCPNGVDQLPCIGSQYSDQTDLTACKTCSAGKYTNDDHTLCIPCAPQENCPDGENIYTCYDGTYFDNGQCKSCPNGEACLNGLQLSCSSGYYISEYDASICLECPPGFACSGSGSRRQCTNEYYTELLGLSSCDECPNQYATLNSSTFCRECDQSEFCPDGVFPVKCPNGEYLRERDLMCVICPKGFKCVDQERISCGFGTFSNITGLPFCYACPLGTYHELPTAVSESSCVPCAKGYFQSKQASKCEACPIGTYSGEEGSTSCTQCPKGTFQDQTGAPSLSSCRPCPRGTFSNQAGSDECTKCSIGESSVEGAQNCTICQPGSYNSVAGEGQCTLCPRGTYNPLYGSTTSADCIDCRFGGSILGATSSLQCDNCTAGFYIFNNTKCRECPKGSYSSHENALECDLCPAGTFQPKGMATSLLDCLACPQGTYSQFNGSSYCTQCEPGQYNDRYGSNSAVSCRDCSSGYYSSSGSAECFICPAGTYSHNKSESCTRCSLGHYAPESGSSTCEPSPPGSYIDTESASSYILCPPGTFNPYQSSLSIDSCTPCPKGTYSATYGAASLFHCVACPSGTFCDQEGLQSFVPCPKGTYSSVEGATNVNTCQKCPKGTFLPRGGSNSRSDCLPCFSGTYGDIEGAYHSSQCRPCPPGTASEVEGATFSGVCTACSPGKYSTGGSSTCFECPVTTYNPLVGANSSEYCVDCPIGKVTLETGSTTVDDCFLCPNGTYFSLRFSQCVPCPSGTYFDFEAEPIDQLKTSESCIACGKGYYQPLEGQIGKAFCKKCTPGTFAEEEANSECTPCGAGFYSSIEASTTFKNCSACPKGSWSSAIVANSSSTCILCPPGTYNDQLAGSSATSCTPCAKGMKAERSGRSRCEQCSSESACSIVGSSFESSSISTLVDETLVFDPKSVHQVVGGYVVALEWSLPIIAVAATAIFLFCLCSLGMVVKKKGPFSIVREGDVYFNMEHVISHGQSQVNQPTIVGGLLSALALILFVGIFVSSTVDFFFNNKTVVENFVNEEIQGIEGKFVFSTIIVGRQEQCNASTFISNFAIEQSTEYCIQGSYTTDQGDSLESCRCVFECQECLPTGASQQVVFAYEGMMMSPAILYQIEAPYFNPDKPYVLNGTLRSVDTLFTGSSQAHVFNFVVSRSRYISISDFQSFLSLLGIRSENEKVGYTIQATSRVAGSQQATDENFKVLEGMRIILDFNSASGTVTSRETVNQTVFTFLAQAVSVLSILFMIGIGVQRCMEHVLIRCVRLFRKTSLGRSILKHDSKEKYIEDWEATSGQENEIHKPTPRMGGLVALK